MPWSWELQSGWGVSGMLTEFFRPSDAVKRRTSEATFAVEKNVTEKMGLFVEYVGDYPESASPSQLLNSGGLYRLSPTQQVDFHIAFRSQSQCPKLHCRSRLFIPVRWIVRRQAEVTSSL
jgi:hypothetical protein